MSNEADLALAGRISALEKDRDRAVWLIHQAEAQRDAALALLREAEKDDGAGSILENAEEYAIEYRDEEWVARLEDFRRRLAVLLQEME